MSGDDRAHTTLSRRVGTAFFGSFDELRPAQRSAIAPALGGRDVLIRAGTGSGKTEAAIAPLVERHLDALDTAAGSVILIVSPTRALANDLVRRLEPVFDQIGLTIGVRHGERKDTTRATPPQVLITTPESLDVMIGQHERALAPTAAVVIDEIHLLANSQRGLQLGIALRRLERWTGRELQVVGLSATLGDPHAVWEFFRPGREAVVVEDHSSNRILHQHVRIGLTADDLADLLDRFDRSEPLKVLVFANSRRTCDAVAERLRSKSTFGYSVFAHHSSLAKDERLHVERQFQELPRAVCVATSTLELGIDIGDINLVVLWGVPADWQSYVQRLGRANRRSEKIEALAVVPIPERDGGLGLDGRLGFQALRDQVDRGDIESTGTFELYGAAAQQFVSISHAAEGAYLGINSFAEVVRDWPHLDIGTVEWLLDALVDQGILRRHVVQRRYGADDGLWELRRTLQIWGNMPLGSREIEIRHGSMLLGRVPGTNLLKLQHGEVLLFSSRKWQVMGSDRDGVKVSPTTSAPTVALKYDRLGPPLDPALAERIRVLLAEGDVGTDVVPSDSRSKLRSELADLRPYAQHDVLPYALQGSEHVYLTFAGAMANSVVAGWATGGRATADAMTIRSPDPLTLADLPTDVSALVDQLDAAALPEAELSIFQTMLPADLRRRELLNEWLRRPIHPRILGRLAGATPTRMPAHLLALVG